MKGAWSAMEKKKRGRAPGAGCTAKKLVNGRSRRKAGE